MSQSVHPLDPEGSRRTATQLNLLRLYPVVAFFVLAYAISWGISLFAARGLLPFAIPRLVTLLAGLLYHFGPALAGIIMAASEAGRAGVRALLRPLGHLRVGVGWYLLIAFYPPALRLAAVGLGAALGGPAPTFFASTALGLPAGNPFIMAVPVFLSTLILTGIAEEIGWRGYALPRLQARHNALVASLILAILWAPWHYNPLNFPAMRAIIPWHVLSVLGMTILMTWVYNGTGGSLGIAVLFHAFSNFADWIVPTSPAVQGDMRAYVAHVLLNLAVASVVVLVFGPTNLSRRTRARADRPGRAVVADSKVASKSEDL
jgi:membrane protease YdiL (CAAX protease family)